MAFRTLSSPVYRTNLSGAVPVTTVHAHSVVDFITSNKSATVRRIKPAPGQLFTSGTTFGHSETKRGSGYGSVSVPFPQLLRYDGPYSYWLSAHGVDDVPNVDLTFNGLDGRLRGRIKDSNLNMAQSVAEYRQAADMFANAASTVYRSFRSLRSGAAIADIARYMRRRDRNIPGDIANRWLEYQYGFRPLMSDIYGMADELTKSMSGEYFRYVSTHSNERYEGATNRTCVLDSRTLFPYQTITQKQVKKVVRARYRISVAGLKQLSQIGITNPALLAWELIPFSFVFDWMIPVGNYLSSLDALAGVSDLAVQRSYRITKKTWATAGDTWETSVQFQRLAVNSGLSLPRLAYQPSTSMLAVANGVALLTQLRSHLR